MDIMKNEEWAELCRHLTALVAKQDAEIVALKLAAPQQHAQAALSDQQIATIAAQFYNEESGGFNAPAFARAILAASQQPAVAPSAPGYEYIERAYFKQPLLTAADPANLIPSTETVVGAHYAGKSIGKSAAAPAIQQEGAALVERAAFEAWCKKLNNAAVRLKGADQYVVSDVQAAWKSWQARAALAAPALVQAAPADAKPFAYFVQPSGFGPFIECESTQAGSFPAYRTLNKQEPSKD